jgi:plastocyanin
VSQLGCVLTPSRPQTTPEMKTKAGINEALIPGRIHIALIPMEKPAMKAKLMFALGGVLTLAAWSAPTARPVGKLVVVKMVDVSATEYRFEPAILTAGAGDTVRFIQSGAMPHNVDFKAVPAGTNLGAAKTGPFLTKAGETYDLVIDGRFAAGIHQFNCMPHEALGMKGTLTVEK